jgi:hypothetical protein
MRSWGFLTNHARVLLCIARDPAARLRDIAASLGITERSAHGIVNDLAGAGYVVKQKDGRRNRYQIQVHLPLPEASHRDLAIGEVLELLAGPQTASRRRDPASDPGTSGLRGAGSTDASLTSLGSTLVEGGAPPGSHGDHGTGVGDARREVADQHP